MIEEGEALGLIYERPLALRAELGLSAPMASQVQRSSLFTHVLMYSSIM
jgi:hypothetical protein